MLDCLSAIARLRTLCQLDVQTNWRCCDEDWSIAQVMQSDWSKWAIADLNEKEHLAWPKGSTIRWFGQAITVPQTLQDYPIEGLCLRLALMWWAESAQVFVNGELVQEGDLFDCSTRLFLSSSVEPGDRISVALRLVSPGHDDGALVKSACLYESLNSLEPSFVADEFEVLHLYARTFDSDQLAFLEAAIAEINWSTLPNREAFDRSLAEVRDRLLPLSAFIKQRQIKLLGHAHLDMAWLWTVDETWKAAERTFRSVLNLQQEFPELIFAHTTPALYEWIEQNRPELFAEIQAQVQAGRWEAFGGIWVEPELNLISGESIARHILYGQRYFQEKFGAISQIAWLPDTFGFNWQLPQFLKLGGIRYFVTQKLRWNDTTQFPHELFWWQAPDGSRVLSLMSAPIGEGIDPVKMATYACDWERKTGVPIALWLPGVGDHGGGPTRDMLELARRWARSPFFPQLEFTTALDYLQQLESDFSENLPVWNDELYLEFHRGCYTTHGDQKKLNRECEVLLYEAEFWAAIAAITTNTSYQKSELEVAWKHVLFNQFHDILPGSAIRGVYQDAEQEWDEAQTTANTILEESLKAIAQQIILTPPPDTNAELASVFNAQNWTRSTLASVVVYPPASLKGSCCWKASSLDGETIETEGDYTKSEIFSGFVDCASLFVNICGFSYSSYWIYAEAAIVNDFIQKPHFILENNFLCVKVSSETGDLVSIFDKMHKREVLSAAGNQLQAFQDNGQYWDAWNIDPNYVQRPQPSTQLEGIQYGVQTELKTQIQIEQILGNSRFFQTYSLEKNSSILEVFCRVLWEDRHVLVKAIFPLSLNSDTATYEISNGAIARTTKPQTDRERAKWEVPALGWADLSDGTYGVSILSDCKHGYDAQSNQLRLTLLRGSEFPDPEADRGYHEFTYAIYPHAENWKTAHTVRRAYELSHPLQTIQLSPKQFSTDGALPPTGQFFDLGAENLVLTAFKQSEDNPDEWVLRCYECHGEEAELRFHSDLGLRLVGAIDLLERPIPNKLQGQTVTIRPWEIASFRVARSPHP